MIPTKSDIISFGQFFWLYVMTIKLINCIYYFLATNYFYSELFSYKGGCKKLSAFVHISACQVCFIELHFDEMNFNIILVNINTTTHCSDKVSQNSAGVNNYVRNLMKYLIVAKD